MTMLCHHSTLVSIQIIFFLSILPKNHAALGVGIHSKSALIFVAPSGDEIEETVDDVTQAISSTALISSIKICAPTSSSTAVVLPVDGKKIKVMNVL